MNSSLNRFNILASVYDFLAKIVFGGQIQRAQLTFIKKLPPEGNILIIGGGTGWMLKDIFSLFPACSIWYVEASDKMLALAKKACPVFNNQIHFIHGTEDTLPHDIGFDAVITNFYLDLFLTSSLTRVVEKIRRVLSKKSIWIVTDFQNDGKWWQQILLWMMYRFFKTMCAIEASNLPPWEDCLRANNYRCIEKKVFFGGFIVSAVYEV